MIKKANQNELILSQAKKAMRKAVKNVIAERKLRGQPLIVWRNGNVVKIPANRLK